MATLEELKEKIDAQMTRITEMRKQMNTLCLDLRITVEETIKIGRAMEEFKTDMERERLLNKLVL